MNETPLPLGEPESGLLLCFSSRSLCCPVFDGSLLKHSNPTSDLGEGPPRPAPLGRLGLWDSELLDRYCGLLARGAVSASCVLRLGSETPFKDVAAIPEG